VSTFRLWASLAWAYLLMIAVLPGPSWYALIWCCVMAVFLDAFFEWLSMPPEEEKEKT